MKWIIIKTCKYTRWCLGFNQIYKRRNGFTLKIKNV